MENRKNPDFRLFSVILHRPARLCDYIEKTRHFAKIRPAGGRAGEKNPDFLLRARISFLDPYDTDLSVWEEFGDFSEKS